MSDQKINNGLVTLGDLIKTQKGFAFKSAWFSKEGRKIVKVSNFSANSVDLSSLAHIPEELAQKYERYRLAAGDVLIQTVGSWPSNPASVVGKVVKVPSGAERALLNQNAVKITPVPGTYNTYLYYALKSSTFSNYIVGTAQGAASQASVTLDSIKGYRLKLPPFTTQHRIASILSAYDDLIENNTRRIAILEEMARRLYEEWFVHFRFPGHEAASFKPSELGSIPDGWEVVTIGDLVNIRRGKTITKKTIEPGNVPVVAGGLRPAYYHSMANTKAPLLTISASGANAGHVSLYHEEVWASDCSFIDSSEIQHVYYYYLLLKVRQEEVTHLQRGSAQPHVYPKDVMRLQAVNAPISLRESFMNHAGPMFRAVHTLLKKNTNLRAQRDLLLPKLVSGEIDISNIPMPGDKEVEAA